MRIGTDQPALFLLVENFKNRIPRHHFSALNLIVGRRAWQQLQRVTCIYVPIYILYARFVSLWLMYMNHIYAHNNVSGQKCGEMSLAIKRNALVAFLAQQSSESIPSTLDRRPAGHHRLVRRGRLRPRPPAKN